VIGLHGKDLAVKCLCLRQTPGLMALDREREGLLNCRRRHGEHSVAKQDTHWNLITSIMPPLLDSRYAIRGRALRAKTQHEMVIGLE